MGNNQHLKRHTAPVSWPIKRKNITFIAKPNPGSHKQKYVTPLVVVLRDVLKYAETSKEVKLILHNSDILVNGKKVTDIKFPVGFFDILEITKTKEKYLIIFDTVGKVKLVATQTSENYLKVSSKIIMSKKQFQINFMNGFNTLVDEKTFKGINVEDTVIFNTSKKKISKVLNLEKGAFVFFFDGKFKGHFGQIEAITTQNGITRDTVQVKIGTESHDTAKAYCFVVGTKKEDLKKFE